MGERAQKDAGQKKDLTAMTMPDTTLTSAELLRKAEVELRAAHIDAFGASDNHMMSRIEVVQGLVADALARAGLEAGKAEESMRERAALPDDLFSHRRAWRDGLVTAKFNAPLARDDQDDAAYWQHEIDVFDRVFAELDAIRALPLTGVDKP